MVPIRLGFTTVSAPSVELHWWDREQIQSVDSLRLNPERLIQNHVCPYMGHQHCPRLLGVCACVLNQDLAIKPGLSLMHESSGSVSPRTGTTGCAPTPRSSRPVLLTAVASSASFLLKIV